MWRESCIDLMLSSINKERRNYIQDIREETGGLLEISTIEYMVS